MGGLRALYVLVTTDGLMTVWFLLFCWLFGFCIFSGSACFSACFECVVLGFWFLVFFLGVFLGGGSYFIFVSGGAQSVRWSVRRRGYKVGFKRLRWVGGELKLKCEV